jgi:ABC-type polysaccharide/polyol phosphate transport system ATPase subunit
MPETVIEFRNVSKTFSHGSGQKLLATIAREWLKRPGKEQFHALRDVSFKVQRGEGFGVIGSNGAGKSTLLGLATGICPPDGGEVIVQGRISSVLELGAGFHTLLTGRENLFLNASLLGMDEKTAKGSYDAIVDFAEIGDFMDDPIRTYSTGMLMRLAFSIAIHLDPDIIILDEVIAVGDANFQEKCRSKLRSLRMQGKTMLCVSHSISSVREMCDKALWIDHGRVMKLGEVSEVLDAYLAANSSN